LATFPPCAPSVLHEAFWADLVDTSRYHNLAEFCARAEALEPFRAAPPEDGATAPLAIDA
jgi:hypothetical protein